MNRFVLAWLWGAIVSAVIIYHPPSAIAENPFKGDYAARFTFTPEDSDSTTKGLLVIAVYSDGHIRMSFINKTADSMYFSKGTINNDGQFEMTTYADGREWGTHKGSLAKSANGNVKATMYEYAKGKEAANGSYEIVGGVNFGETK